MLQLRRFISAKTSVVLQDLSITHRSRSFQAHLPNTYFTYQTLVSKRFFSSDKHTPSNPSENSEPKSSSVKINQNSESQIKNIDHSRESHQPRQNERERTSYQPRQNYQSGGSYQPRQNEGDRRSYQPRQNDQNGGSYQSRQNEGDGRYYQPRQNEGDRRSYQPRKNDQSGGSYQSRHNYQNEGPYQPKQNDQYISNSNSYAPKSFKGDYKKRGAVSKPSSNNKRNSKSDDLEYHVSFDDFKSTLNKVEVVRTEISSSILDEYRPKSGLFYEYLSKTPQQLIEKYGIKVEAVLELNKAKITEERNEVIKKISTDFNLELLRQYLRKRGLAFRESKRVLILRIIREIWGFETEVSNMVLSIRSYKRKNQVRTGKNESLYFLKKKYELKVKFEDTNKSVHFSGESENVAEAQEELPQILNKKRSSIVCFDYEDSELCLVPSSSPYSHDSISSELFEHRLVNSKSLQTPAIPNFETNRIITLDANRVFGIDSTLSSFWKLKIERYRKKCNKTLHPNPKIHFFVELGKVYSFDKACPPYDWESKPSTIVSKFNSLKMDFETSQPIIETEYYSNNVTLEAKFDEIIGLDSIDDITRIISTDESKLLVPDGLVTQVTLFPKDQEFGQELHKDMNIKPVQESDLEVSQDHNLDIAKESDIEKKGKYVSESVQDAVLESRQESDKGSNLQFKQENTLKSENDWNKFVNFCLSGALSSPRG
ncbi:hypothetical protein AYI68_g8189 [Smittium mucronatum]|uniref:SAP domain-containing protein n=1 Tax=Smittium mucronatum TaxID=133383 RepID=A0A1R0GLL7_9FUNG|nr:hypothetical protein AYI68_g8189 [Smittium mucronatum]